MKIIPKPTEITMLDGEFVFSKNTQLIGLEKVSYDSIVSFLDFEDGEPNKCIYRITDIDGDYKIEIGESIYVLANGKEGLFHATQTLKQLIFEYYKNGYSCIPNCIIEDESRFEYRGFMLDVCRHFFDVDTIKKFIDVLALLKMNKFHLHLSDDQGFRVQINSFPALTDIGSKRAGTRGDRKEVNGYYTQQEIISLVQYASERYIEIIPEIDLPGHTTAMVASYPDLHCKGKEIDVAEYFGIMADIICAGKESSYQIINSILDEMVMLFPSKYFHLGGDEVPKIQWMNCEDCAKKMEENNLKTYCELQGYFTNRMINYLKEHNKIPILWNEAMLNGELDASAIIQYWKDDKSQSHIKKALVEDKNVIYSENSAYYTNYPYGTTSLKKTYLREPIIKNILPSLNENIMGVEGCLWTEWVETEENAFYKALPRLIAISETAWSNSKNKNYKDFKKRLSNMLNILYSYDINSATISRSNPGPIVSIMDNMIFYGKMIDKNALNSLKNYKSIKK